MAQPAKHPVPEGMHNITAHLWFDGRCSDAITFYQKVFDAQIIAEPVPWPGGKGVIHSMIKIGDSNIMMADAWPDMVETAPNEHTSVGIFFYTPDCDAVYTKALDEGCTVVNEMMDTFWGDRMGKIRDPFGHVWAIATY